MYRIGDYAKYLGVTPDFLKHYEQFRFVSSETKGNGYRYYPFGQSYKILECMRLRNYGMSLRDIDVALVDDDPETLMETNQSSSFPSIRLNHARIRRCSSMTACSKRICRSSA